MIEGGPHDLIIGRHLPRWVQQSKYHNTVIRGQSINQTDCRLPASWLRGKDLGARVSTGLHGHENADFSRGQMSPDQVVFCLVAFTQHRQALRSPWCNVTKRENKVE